MGSQIQVSAVVFTDLVSSTEMLSSLGRDEAERVRQTLFALIRSSVGAHRGREVKNLGDGFMLSFPSATDALRCAASMHAATARQRQRSPEIPLVLRTGVAFGEVTEEAGDLFGEAVVVASRLCAVAEAGGVLATTVTVQVADRGLHARVDHLGPRSLKGLPGEVEVSRLRWAEVADPSPAVPSSLVLPDVLVGRAAALARLHDAMRDAHSAATQLVLIEGEAGAGKSALAAAFAHGVAEYGGRIAHGTCLPSLDLGLGPFLEAFGQLVAGAELDTLSAGERRDLLPATSLVPGLADRLDVDDVPASAAEIDRRLAVRSVIELLRHIARGQPLAVVIDDLQWASEPTLVLLRHLVSARVPGVLFVGTVRRSDVPDVGPTAVHLAEIGRLTGVVRDAVAPLDLEAVAHLAAVLRPERAGEMDVLARVVHGQSAGNALFATELLRHDRVGEVLPATLRDAVQLRLSALGEEAARVLAVVAVAGETVDIELAEAVSPSGADVLGALELAMSRDLLREDDVDTFSFTHPIVREVAADGLSASRRVRVHQAAGAALRARTDPRSRVAAARHLLAGRTRDTATLVDAVVCAAVVELEMRSVETALELVTEALAQLDDGVHEPDPGMVVDLRICEAKARLHLPATDATEPVRRLLAAALDAGDARRLCEAMRAGLFALPIGKVDPTFEACAAFVVSDPPDDPAARALGLTSLARYHASHSGDLDAAQRWSEEAVAVARTVDDVEVQVRVLGDRSIALSGFADLELRRSVADELLATAERTNALLSDVWSGVALTHRAAALLAGGDLAGFDADLDRASELNRRLGWSYLDYIVTAQRTMRAQLRGEYDIVGEGIERLFAIAAGDTTLPAGAVAAGALFVRQRDQGGLRDLLPLLELHDRELTGVAGFAAARALALCETGGDDDIAESAEILRRLAEADFTKIPRDQAWLAWAVTLTHVAAAVGDERSGAALERLLDPFAGQFNVVGAVLVDGAIDRCLAELAVLRGDVDRGIALARRALALERSLGAEPSALRTSALLAALLRRDGGASRDAVAEAERLQSEAEQGAVLYECPGVLWVPAAIVADSAPSRSRRSS